ncbi:MAG: hypothetical protein H0T76_21750 [Nannocystis sp.]|nr:hypothetical protein [Nannocystis sp.]MBA3549118.1 hypothetical protein [Nannocystis sp.]
MSWRRASPVLALAAAAACLPDNPLPLDTDGQSTTLDSGVTTGVTTGGAAAGLFGCMSDKCTLVLVSQTLDDRIDVFDVSGATPSLRGRINLDLKPDASGLQTSGLLDEPYSLALTDSDLLVALGHYPASDAGSLLRFPRAIFAELEPGEVFGTDRYFQSGVFTGGVEALAHGRQEGIFLLPHPSGRVLIGVFANNLQTTQWTTPSELLIADPMDLAAGVASVDLGALPTPCVGAWELQALDPAVSKVALACDGSESVAVLSLPADFGTAPLAEAAKGVTGCGATLGGASQSTQFVSGDGAGGFLAVQSQLSAPPRLWHVLANCTTGKPTVTVPEALNQVRLLRQPALLRATTSDAPPLWLVAAGPTENGVVIVQGGASPTMCGALTGLDVLAAENSPWALALAGDRTHLAIGAGPASNPQLSSGRGQVLWATLDTSGLDSCQLHASQVVDLGAGMFSASQPATWMRAPNVVVVAELGGAS